MDNRSLYKEEKWILPDFPIVDLGIIPILPSTLQITLLGNLPLYRHHQQCEKETKCRDFLTIALLSDLVGEEAITRRVRVKPGTGSQCQAGSPFDSLEFHSSASAMLITSISLRSI